MNPNIDSVPPEASPALRSHTLALANPLRRLLERDAARGVVLITAAAFAMLWANSPWGDTYQAFWHSDIIIQAGDLRVTTTMQHLVNDVLMVGFFFVVGLEIRSELHDGELS